MMGRRWRRSVVGIIAVAALVYGCQATGAASTSSVRVDVVMEDMRFTPSRIDVRAGQTLEIHLTNLGPQRHDLVFPALEMPGLRTQEAVVEPGATAVMTISFDTPGSYPFMCDLPGHASAGMTGAVFVSH